MEHTFGTDATMMLRRYHRNLHKLASLKNRRTFLLKCRSQGIPPDHISDKTRTFTQLFEYHDARTGQWVENFNNRLVHKVISMEISITIKNLNFLTHRQAQLKDNIRQTFPEHVWLEFDHRCTLRFNREFHKIRDVQTRKFNRLKSEFHKIIPTQTSWFKNISDTNFPEDISSLLALGPKFSLQPSIRDISVPHLLAEIESINYDRDAVNKPLITARITNILTNWVQKKYIPRSNLHHSFVRTATFLRQHPEVIITSADKGNSTVAMNRDTYHLLAETILSDEQYYKRLSRDPTSTFQQKANKLISGLKKDGMIQDAEASKLTIYNSRPARFYGLPKIHKPTLALRPIISSISCPNSNIAQHITDVLTRAYNRDNTFYTADSFEFASFINNFVLPTNYVIVSFDVKSLFTNIPVELVCDSIERRWTDIQPHTEITLDRFLQLVNFVFNTTYFTYNDRYYQQIFGTPMGSVVSPIAAQYVMDDFLSGCLSKLPFTMPFIRKYVDDIICGIPEGTAQSTLEVFNSLHERIQFTIEEENNFAVPFLDTLVIREDNVIKTDWYIKPTASGRYINFHSFHTTRMKINTINNMKNRVLRLSHPTFKLNNLKKLYDIMIKNSFPSSMLNKLLYSTPVIDSLAEHRRADVVQQPPTDLHYRSLPYIDQLSQKLISTLSIVPGLKIALKNCKRVRNLYTPLKDKTPVSQQSGVVYMVPCSNCNLSYIGQTGRSLHARLISHKSDVRTNKTSCQLSIHVNQLGHLADFDNVKILDRENNTKKRTFLEMVRISQSEETMNSRKDIEGLSSVYTYLLHLDKNTRQNSDQEEPEELSLTM